MPSSWVKLIGAWNMSDVIYIMYIKNSIYVQAIYRKNLLRFY